MVSSRHVENCTATRSTKPFVNIADEEIWVEGCEVKWDMANSVGAVDKGEDPFFFTDFGEGFERDEEAGERGDSVVECESWSLSFCSRSGNCFFEESNESRVG